MDIFNAIYYVFTSGEGVLGIVLIGAGIITYKITRFYTD